MHPLRLAERAGKIRPFYVMELLERAKRMEAGGRHIIHMEVGEPDFPTPRLIKERAIGAIGDNRTYYTHSLGLPELREAIALHYRTTTGVDVSPDRIIITNGTSGAFLLLFSVLLESGASVALADPGYPCYRNFAELFSANIMALGVRPEHRYEVRIDDLETLSTLPDLVVFANPANPTGTVYTSETLHDLISFLSAKGIPCVVDEIYSGITYERSVVSALSFSDDSIVIDGFSKRYAMTGWRLGWMVVPAELVRPVQKVAQSVYISPPAISQYGAIAAFENDVAEDIAAMCRIYRERRDYLLPRLRTMGFDIPLTPEGAFYIYAGIERWGIDSMDFTRKALEEAGVAITPGLDFGSFGAETHVRFTYATGLDDIETGCGHLEKWLATL